MSIADLLVPRRAVALPVTDPAVAEVRRHLEGLEVIPAVDIWLHGPDLLPGPEPADDDAYDRFTDGGGVRISAEDQWVPTLDERAEGIVADLARIAGRPGVYSWRRWAVTYRVSRWAYSFGFGPCVSGVTWDEDGQYATGPLHLVWPACRRRWTCDGEPRVSWIMGYLFGQPGWWWACLWRQVRYWPHLVRHLPEEPWAFGVCAACVPCPECGARQDCVPGCSLNP